MSAPSEVWLYGVNFDTDESNHKWYSSDHNKPNEKYPKYERYILPLADRVTDEQIKQMLDWFPFAHTSGDIENVREWLKEVEK